jgi:hypothetical protein
MKRSFLTRATNGLVVLEIPPANGGSITGRIDDAWQNPLGRYLLRAVRPRRQGVQLGADRRESPVRSPLPHFWAGAVRFSSASCG